MKTYTAYSITRGVAASLAFIVVGLPILAVVSAVVLVVGLGASFFAESSFAAFWDTFSCGLKDFGHEIKDFLVDFGIFSFHS